MAETYAPKLEAGKIKSIDVPPTARSEIKVSLSAPIATHDGIKSELTFDPSKLKGKHLMKFGEPIRSHTKGFGADAEVHRTVNYPAVFHIAAAATGTTEDLLSEVPLSDAGKIVGAVLDMMVPTGPTNTTA